MKTLSSLFMVAAVTLGFALMALAIGTSFAAIVSPIARNGDLPFVGLLFLFLGMFPAMGLGIVSEIILDYSKKTN